MCCESSLQTRAKVVSILHLLGAVVALIYGGSKIPKLPKLYSLIDHDNQHLSIDAINLASHKLLVSSIAHVTYGILTIGCVALVMESAWGNHKPKLLMPWLVINAFSIVTSFVVIGIMKPLDPNYSKTICYMVFAVTTSYFWCIILSFYWKLTEESHERVVRNNLMENEIIRNLL